MRAMILMSDNYLLRHKSAVRNRALANCRDDDPAGESSSIRSPTGSAAMSANGTNDEGELPTVVQQPPLTEILNEKIERAAEYARAARSSATPRAYASERAIFSAWCEAHALQWYI